MRAGRSGIVKEPERKEKNVGMEAARAFFGGYQVISYQLSVRVLSVGLAGRAGALEVASRRAYLPLLGAGPAPQSKPRG